MLTVMQNCYINIAQFITTVFHVLHVFCINLFMMVFCVSGNLHAITEHSKKLDQETNMDNYTDTFMKSLKLLSLKNNSFTVSKR